MAPRKGKETHIGRGVQVNLFMNIARSEWDPKFSTRRKDVKHTNENVRWIDTIDLEEEGFVRSFMKSSLESDSCLPRADKVEEWCFGASLDMLQRNEGGGTRVVALLDERCKAETEDKARKHRGPLTARGLYQQLRKPRYDDIESGQGLTEIPDKRGIATALDSDSDLEQELQEELEKYDLDPEEEIQPDAERTKIFITDLDRWSIIALMATASESQAPGLREAIYMHLKFENFIGVTFPTLGIAMFQLAFHIPFCAWRTSNSATAREDHRLNSKAKRLRNSQNVSFLNWEGSGSSDFLYEAQYSCLIAGTDETHWVAYGFFDTYFDDEAKETAEGYYNDSLDDDGILADPLTFGNVDAQKSIPTAREYWLCVLQNRIDHVLVEWEQVVIKVGESISEYEETTHSRSSRLSKEDSPEGDKMDDEHIRKSRDWVVHVKRLTKKLYQQLARTVGAWEKYLRHHAIYFQDLQRVSDNGIRSLPAIQQVFDRLESLEQTLEDLAERCAGFAQELEIQISLENRHLASEARKSSMIMMVSIPIALASGCLSINSVFISFIPPRFGLVAFAGLAIMFGLLGILINLVIQYQNSCWQTIMALTGRGSWRKIFQRKQEDSNESNG